MASRLSHDLDPATLAIAALSHFATDPETLDRFFALTGLDVDGLREAAGTPEFVRGILDFVVGDERVLLAVAEAQEVAPDAIVALQQRLNAPPPDEDWPPRQADDVA